MRSLVASLLSGIEILKTEVGPSLKASSERGILDIFCIFSPRKKNEALRKKFETCLKKF
jgi:hypothetical protein